MLFSLKARSTYRSETTSPVAALLFLPCNSDIGMGGSFDRDSDGAHTSGFATHHSYSDDETIIFECK